MQISRYYRHYLEQRRNRLSPTNLRKIPTKKFKKGKWVWSQYESKYHYDSLGENEEILTKE